MQKLQDELNDFQDPVKRTAPCYPSSSFSLTARATGGGCCGQAKTSPKIQRHIYIQDIYSCLPNSIRFHPLFLKDVTAGRIGIRRRLWGSGCHITVIRGRHKRVTRTPLLIPGIEGISGLCKSLGTSDVAGGPCPLGHAGRDTSAAHQPQRFLYLLIAEGVNYGVDHRVVGGGNQGGIRVKGRVRIIGYE